MRDRAVNKATTRLWNVSIVIWDAILVIVGGYLALVLRFDGNIPAVHARAFYRFCLPMSFAWVISYHIWRVYECMWSAPSTQDYIRLVMASAQATVVAGALVWFGAGGYPRSAMILMGLLSVLFAVWPRALAASSPKPNTSSLAPNTVIIGAGDAGVLLANEILRNRQNEYRLVGFIDDDSTKKRTRIHGLEVLGNLLEARAQLKRLNVTHAIVAMPEASQDTIGEQVRLCVALGLRCKITPDLFGLLKAGRCLDLIRDVKLEDLIGRSPVEPDRGVVEQFLRNRRIVVTGAGGSIGSEIVRQVIEHSPQSILLIGHGENSIFELYSDISELIDDTAVVQLAIADVRDPRRMTSLFRAFHPDIVFHAAAHKHVTLMEANPSEAVGVNVKGTLNVARASADCGASHLVFVSTDKAVNPSSVMGATKRIAEQVIQAIAHQTQTVMTCVRFGNVLGSRGSLLPILQRQIAKGGPIRLTHPDMTRYFMSIPEAVSLVIQAGAQACNGEIYLLNMGRPVKILDLAINVIRLAGLIPYEDIDIEFIGPRPGEKMCEELIFSRDGLRSSNHPDILVTSAPKVESTEFWQKLEWLLSADDDKGIKAAISAMVPEYAPVDLGGQREAAATTSVNP